VISSWSKSDYVVFLCFWKKGWKIMSLDVEIMFWCVLSVYN